MTEHKPHINNNNCNHSYGFEAFINIDTEEVCLMCCKHKRCEVDNDLGNLFCVECGEICCSQATKYEIQLFTHGPQLFTRDHKSKKPRPKKPSASEALPRCDVLERKVHRIALWSLARIKGIPFYHTHTDRELRIMLNIEPPDRGKGS